MKSNGSDQKTLAVCFGQFGPYHHARVAALQRLAREMGDGSSAEDCKLNTADCRHAWRVLPVQIASATSTYAWSGPSGVAAPRQAEDLKTLCAGVEEEVSPLDVFLKARKLFREEKVDVAFLPSYSPARYFALLAAAKSLGIRTVMMNESHAGTEQATGWKRWIKRQIVKQFDAALVGGEPHKRHFASLGIPADKIFTGYDAVDNALFAAKADEVRKKSGEWREPESAERALRQTSDELGEGEEKADEVCTPSSPRARSRGSKEQVLPEAEDLSTLNAQPSTTQSLRSAYGLPGRYFLSLGRMVEKKNLSTLIAAYARFARASVEKHGAGGMEHGEKKHGAGSMEHGVRSASAPNDYGVTRGETADGGDPHAGGQAAAATSAEPRLCETGLSQNCKLNTEHCVPALVFVGSGELESVLREQASGLGLRVVDRTDWKAGQSGHRLTRINTDGSERLAADRTGGDASCRVTPAVGDESVTAKKSLNPQPSTLNKENCGTVFFYGFRQIEENPVFYALAEAFVLPSLKEEWGLVVNEAMAAGLPVIVSRTAGCAEDLVPASGSVEHGAWSMEEEAEARAGWSVEHGAGGMESGENADADDCRLKTENSLEQRSNGFVFDPSSVDALSEALRRIADPLNVAYGSSPAIRPTVQRSTLNAAAMGRRSREIVEKFSCENFARQALSAARAALQG